MFGLFGDSDGDPGDDVVDDFLEFKEVSDLMRGDFTAVVVDEVMKDIL